jgi:hypothetical protein
MWRQVTWHCCFTWMFGHCVFMEHGMWWSSWLWYVKILELCVWCIYMYISGPNCFSVNAEGANYNVVFILSRAVFSVTFMRCQTVCIKIFCDVCYCTGLSQVPVFSFAQQSALKLCTKHWYQSGQTTRSCKPNIAFRENTEHHLYSRNYIILHWPFSNRGFHCCTHSVHISVHILYTFCTHFCTCSVYILCTFLYTFCTHFCTHSAHLLFTFLYTFLYTFVLSK